MSTLNVPRYGVPLIGPDGLMNRDWYRYFAALPGALNNSPTSYEDSLTLSAMEDASIAVEVAHIGRVADRALAAALLGVEADAPTPPDTALLAWWPL